MLMSSYSSISLQNLAWHLQLLISPTNSAERSSNQVFSQHQKVVFLAHSMGGIIVRQYLLGNQDRIPSVPMIYFDATPTAGSEWAALARIASANPQLRGMTPIESNDFLQSIQSEWLDLNKAQSIASYCGVEELQTDGQIIVPRSSATSLCKSPWILSRRTTLT